LRAIKAGRLGLSKHAHNLLFFLKKNKLFEQNKCLTKVIDLHFARLISGFDDQAEE
jgi:hypothetical protein